MGRKTLATGARGGVDRRAHFERGGGLKPLLTYQIARFVLFILQNQRVILCGGFLRGVPRSLSVRANLADFDRFPGSRVEPRRVVTPVRVHAENGAGKDPRMAPEQRVFAAFLEEKG